MNGIITFHFLAFLGSVTMVLLVMIMTAMRLGLCTNVLYLTKSTCLFLYFLYLSIISLASVYLTHIYLLSVWLPIYHHSCITYLSIIYLYAKYLSSMHPPSNYLYIIHLLYFYTVIISLHMHTYMYNF